MYQSQQPRVIEPNIITPVVAKFLFTQRSHEELIDNSSSLLLTLTCLKQAFEDFDDTGLRTCNFKIINGINDFIYSEECNENNRTMPYLAFNTPKCDHGTSLLDRSYLGTKKAQKKDENDEELYLLFTNKKTEFQPPFLKDIAFMLYCRTDVDLLGNTFKKYDTVQEKYQTRIEVLDRQGSAAPEEMKNAAAIIFLEALKKKLENPLFSSFKQQITINIYVEESWEKVVESYIDMIKYEKIEYPGKFDDDGKFQILFDENDNIFHILAQLEEYQYLYWHGVFYAHKARNGVVHVYTFGCVKTVILDSTAINLFNQHQMRFTMELFNCNANNLYSDTGSFIPTTGNLKVYHSMAGFSNTLEKHYPDNFNYRFVDFNYYEHKTCQKFFTENFLYELEPFANIVQPELKVFASLSRALVNVNGSLGETYGDFNK